MITYKAMYKYIDDGVHAEVLDFPGVISSGADLDEARCLLEGALVDMAETILMDGDSLPPTDQNCTDLNADIEEPIHLVLTAASHITVIPAETAS